jgi:hypothetical protein
MLGRSKKQVIKKALIYEVAIKHLNISATYPKAEQENKPQLVFNDCAAVRSIAKALITRRDAVLSSIVFPCSNG